MSVSVSELRLNYTGEKGNLIPWTNLNRAATIPLPLSQGITIVKKDTCGYHMSLYHILKRHALRWSQSSILKQNNNYKLPSKETT